MEKFFTKLASFVTAFALVFGSLASFAQAAEVVSADTSSAENQPGWMFNRDQNTKTPYSWSLDSKVLGNGSLFVAPIGDANEKDKFVAENFIGELVENFQKFSFDFKIAGNSASDARHFYMNVYANFGESAADKFYDCRYVVAATSGSTEEFTTLTFDSAQEYSVTTRNVASDPTQNSPFTCPGKLSDMNSVQNAEGISTQGNAVVRVVAINVGDTSTEDKGVSAYLDNVVVTKTSGEVITYDFEPDAENLIKNNQGGFFDTIQEAIDGTTEGGEVTIPSGSFKENLIINKKITLVGAGDTTIIEPVSGGAVYITASDVTLEGLKLVGKDLDGTRGIEIQAGAFSGIIVKNVEVRDWHTGVFINSGQSVSVENLDANNNVVGLAADGPRSVVITNSSFADNIVEAIGTSDYSAPEGAEGVQVTRTSFSQNGATISVYDLEAEGWTAGPVLASENWWGTEQGPGEIAGVTVQNWYVNPAMTRLNTDSTGGSRSGGSRSNNTPAGEVLGDQTGPVGEVLGASAYNFTRDLTVGLRGDDVTALQAALIASGDLAIAAPTGYFGDLTKAAVAKWQARNGVPATGYFGPLSRAAFASAGTPAATMTAEQRAAAIAELLKKVAELQEKIKNL